MRRIGIIVFLFLSALPVSAQCIHSKKDGNGGYYTSNTTILENTNSRYNTLQSYYNKNDYYTIENPRFGLALPWVNVVIPGLAQYIMAEPGLGTQYLLMHVGFSAMTSLGGVMTRRAYMNDETTGAAYTGGRILIIVGGIGNIAVAITSIINAYDVVKVKSLYIEDVKNYRRGYSFSLEPTVNYAFTPSGSMPAPGIGLRVSF